MRPHEPTDQLRKQVQTLTAVGVPEHAVAKIMSIDPKTLRKYYPDELDFGHHEANAAVARNLFSIATSNDKGAVTAAIFWLKCRAGWSEYAPAPSGGPNAEHLGKKEQAELDAIKGAAGTDWEHLLN